MISRTVLAIALLLCANHVANAYILLSANIEDIKKVASKFLSSDVVEQLTSLIGKFTNNKNNLSEENKKNEKTINRISDDEIEERATTRPKPTKSKPKDETKKRDRYKISEYINEVSQKKQKGPGGRYKVAGSANQLSKDESEERLRHKNTPDSLRERDTYGNRQNKEDKDREGDLYWNDDKKQSIERVVATSGRLKLPRENRGIEPKIYWDISSDN